MRIGTRASTMALAQTGDIATAYRVAHPDKPVEIVEFSTKGDRDQTSRLDIHGGKGGAFVSEIRDAIRENRLDAAMHSLKDMPGDEETPGLVIGAYMKREPIEDALILREGETYDAFVARGGEGYKIGSNSVRRRALLGRLYPAAEVIHFRGAADTRIKKLDEGTMQMLPDGNAVGPADALILARCGLERLGVAHRAAHIFSPEELAPALGQGIVAVECRANDFRTLEALAAVDDPDARVSAIAEREMLWILNGHCNSPIAGHGTVNGDAITLYGAVMSEAGDEIIESRLEMSRERPRELGRAVGMALLDLGAAALIEKSRP
ncbi:MAG: hydroxymethylbilane synthase [Planctomycetota bacterium]